MKLKTIGKAVSSPIWVPLLPLIYTIKRLQRTHDDSRAVIGDLHADIRQKLAARKGQARTEEQQEDSAELSFEEAVQLAERNAAIRGEQYSLAATDAGHPETNDPGAGIFNISGWHVYPDAYLHVVWHGYVNFLSIDDVVCRAGTVPYLAN